ncbi:MAG: hypothetical protein HUN05_13080 [Desulfobacter sp.]|nr:MAG: hypothetical protein HUN05_13080 [Desulfobacter sp.]
MLGAALFAVLIFLNRVALGVEDASRQRHYRTVTQSVFEIGRFFMAVCLILWLSKPSAEMALAGFVLSGLVTMAVHFFFLKELVVKSSGKPQLDQDQSSITDIRRLTRFQRPLIISNLCVWVVIMTERWSLQYFGSLFEVGGYAAVYQLAFAPMIFLSNFFIILTEPIIYQIVGAGKSSEANKKIFLVNQYLSAGILILSLGLSMFFFFFHSTIGYFLLGEAFRSYSWLFPWLVFAGGCFATGQQLLLKLSCEMRTQDLAKLWGTLALVATASYVIGAGFWQLKGVLAAVVFVNIVLVALAFHRAGQQKNSSIESALGAGKIN